MQRRLLTTSNALPFGYYLENRSTFLRDIAEKVKSKTISQQEDKLLSILQRMGTAQTEAKELVAVKYPELFDGIITGAAKHSFNLKQMLACSMHLGHATHKWNPMMAPFLHGERQGIHIIDLEKTLACLRQACQVVTDVVAKSGTLLFVGTRESFRRLTYEAAVDCGQCYVNLRWLGGTITNRTHVLRDSQLMPDLLIVLDYINNEKAVVEANKSNIPVIAICDSDCDPSKVTYPIPANDDAFASVELVARVLSLAALEGVARRARPSSSIVSSAQDFVQRVF